MFGEFDEAAYLRVNPDVRGMVERGLFRSGFEHWHAIGANEHALGDRVSGFYEHDLIYDEAAYLRQNADVADAVRTRAVRNGYQHWIRFGRKEFARGDRLGPFTAKGGLLRAFAIPGGDGAPLFVGRAPASFRRASTVEVRAGAGKAIVLDGSAVACSREIEIVDACGDSASVRFLVCRAPSDLVIHRGASRVVVSIAFDEGDPLALSYRDAGAQAFFFRTADGANEFLRTARKASEYGRQAGVVPTTFALDRLLGGPRSPGYEKPLRFRIETAAWESGAAVVAAGWLAVPASQVERCRAWFPEICEFSDLTKTWLRRRRVDVKERFRDELTGSDGEEFGFEARSSFTEPMGGHPRTVLYGFKVAGDDERWLELDLEP